MSRTKSVVRKTKTGVKASGPSKKRKKQKRRAVQPYDERGTALTEDELQRVEILRKSIPKIFRGWVRIFQGGAAGTKG